MPDPKGRLVTPVGFRPDNSIHSLALDASDRLLVLIDAITSALRVTSLPHDVFSQSGVIQIGANGLATNSSVTLYTAPAGHTGYLTSIFLGISNQTASATNVHLEVLDSSNVVLWEWNLGGNASQIAYVSFSPPVPIQIPTGGYIRIRSGAVNLYGYATITGYQV